MAEQTNNNTAHVYYFYIEKLIITQPMSIIYLYSEKLIITQHVSIISTVRN